MRKSKGEMRLAEARSISVSMKRLMTGYRTLLEARLEGEGITLAQLRMLNALSEQPEVSAAGLARTCYITPQSMQAQVKRAEQQHWITRTPSSSNRRVLKATLNPSGRKALERGMELVREIEGEIWGGAKLSDLEAFNATLADAIARLQPSLDELHARGAAARRKSMATQNSIVL